MLTKLNKLSFTNFVAFLGYIVLFFLILISINNNAEFYYIKWSFGYFFVFIYIPLLIICVNILIIELLCNNALKKQNYRRTN